MIIWKCKDWQKKLSQIEHRSGIRFRFEKGVDPSVRESILNFSKWLKSSYVFPLRVPVYVKAAYRLKAIEGDFVVGTFFRPNKYGEEPYIRLAAGDYQNMKKENGRDNALASILLTLTHELTHYFQYINDAKQTYRGEEVQASKTANIILDEYKQTRDHP